MKKLLYILIFVPLVLFGQDNYSLSFDGVDDYVSIGQITLDNDFSFDTWVYVNPDANLSYSDAGAHIFNLGASNISWASFAFGVSNNTDITTFPTIIVETGQQNQAISNYPFPLGEWVHIAISFNYGIIDIYQNGVNVLNYDTGLTGISSNYDAAFIGSRGPYWDNIPAYGNGWYFNGIINYIRSFDHPISDEEVQSYMNCPTSHNKEGLVGYWNFNEGAENSLYDSSGNGNHGVVFGANYIEDTSEIVCEENPTSIVEFENEFNSVLLALQSNFNIELLDDITPINQNLVYQNNSTDDVIFELDSAQYYLLNIEGSATLCSGSGWCNWDALYEFHQDGSSFNNIIDFSDYTSIFPTRLYYLIPENFSTLDTSYTINHDYWFLLSGEQLFFSFHDADGSYGDNQGMLNFNLYALSQPFINNLLVGCKNSNAINFDETATIDDEQSCIYSQDYVHALLNEVDNGAIEYEYLQEEYNTLNTNLNNTIDEATTSLSSLQQALDTWNTTIDLSAGWNMFGYGCPSSIGVADGLSIHTESIIITKDNNGAVYYPEFDFNGIGDFTPGFGYQIKLTDAIEGFSLCDWYVNDIPEDNIVSLQEENADLNQQIKCLTNPEVGDFCHGGIIFYIDSNNEYGLVMAEEDVNGLYEWGCHNLTDNISFTNSIGLGYENSINISENDCLDLGELSAAEAALNFQSNSYNDWYLPSNKELITIYDSLDVISLGFENSYYWSSSPHSISEMAYCIQPILGYTANIQSTTNTFKVRPIRAFGNWTIGCMDETACNFNPEANMADGSCTYPEQLFDCDGNKYGCLDEVACNYDEIASLDNGSCDYAQQGYDCDGNILEVGVEAYGGIVYYIDESGEHGLVAAPQDIGQHSWFDAIDVCNDYVINGYTDWYLPNVIELDLMYNSIGPHLEIDYGFSNEDDANLSWYWASDDYGFAGGTITFSNGQQHFGHVKSELSHVRPIRSF